MSSSVNPNPAKVRRTLLPRSSISAALVALESVRRAGAGCRAARGSSSCNRTRARPVLVVPR